MVSISASMAAILVLGLAVVAPPDWLRAELVTVVATEYAFAPSRLTLRVGVPYRLHLENRGQELHEFTAPAFFQSVALANADALNADQREVVLQPGVQKDLYLVPRKPGRYPFVCADHDWAGMTGEILVESGG
jgi:uncharacterized cupredoxin-like copper-binding protein